MGIVGVMAALLLFANAAPVAAAALTSVLVKNTAAAPVLTRDVDQTAQKPFQTRLHVSFVTDQLGGSASFTVPAGKRLVLEYVTGDFVVENGMVVVFNVSTTAGGTAAVHQLVLTSQGAAGGYPASYAGAQEVRLYADPGTTVTLGALRQLGGTGEGWVSVSGYLTAA